MIHKDTFQVAWYTVGISFISTFLFDEMGIWRMAPVVIRLLIQANVTAAWSFYGL